MKSSGSGFATFYPFRYHLFFPLFGYCRRLFQAVLVVSEHCNLLFNFVSVPFFAFLLPYVRSVLHFQILVWRKKKLAKVMRASSRLPFSVPKYSFCFVIHVVLSLVPSLFERHNFLLSLYVSLYFYARFHFISSSQSAAIGLDCKLLVAYFQIRLLCFCLTFLRRLQYICKG